LLGGPATAGLPEREWDHANGHKHNQVKGASKKMRFAVWFSLFFHGGLGLGAVFPQVPKPSQKKRLGKLSSQVTGSTETCQRYFQAIYKSRIEMIPLKGLSRVAKPLKRLRVLIGM
jgi:hypothetical protein